MSIDKTQDGGYVFAGHSASPGTHGGNDIWVVKLDSNGNQQWQSFMGGSNNEFGYSIRQTADGGYIVAGDTFSNDIETAGNDVGGIYAARLDSSGTVLWERAIGGSGDDYGSSIIPALDGGYILAGYSNSADFGSGQRKGYDDVVVMKIAESDGKLVWLKVLGGIGYDRTGYDNVISPTTDGGYILTAQSTSGDLALIHGSFDTLVVKLNQDGSIQSQQTEKWQKLFGGTLCEVIGSITPLTDGGYIVTSQAGSSQSGDVVEENYGQHDIWVLRLDADGNIVWQKLMGGNRWDQSTSIRETKDGGYIFAGFTQSSNSGYIGINRGYEDAWVVKLNPRLAVDILDADTNEPVYGATVSLYDVAHDEERNATAINGYTSFSESGESLQYRLVVGNKYSVRATAEGYFDSKTVAVTYSGDGQRVMVNITAMNRTIAKSFSITNAWVDDDGYLKKNHANNLSGILGPEWTQDFHYIGSDATKAQFGVNPGPFEKTLNHATIHFHYGHGGQDPPTRKTAIQLKITSSPSGKLVDAFLWPSEITTKWGGKNKWVVLQSCLILDDKDWGGVLGTTHGIFGYKTPTNFDATEEFLQNAKSGKTLTDSWITATNSVYKTPLAINWTKDISGNWILDEKNKGNVSAAVIFRNQIQMDQDHLPGFGEIAPDYYGDNQGKRRIWDCGSGVITND